MFGYVYDHNSFIRHTTCPFTNDSTISLFAVLCKTFRICFRLPSLHIIPASVISVRIGSFLPVPDWFGHRHVFCFRYRTDWRPVSLAFRQYLKNCLQVGTVAQLGCSLAQRVQRSSLQCSVVQTLSIIAQKGAA